MLHCLAAPDTDQQEHGGQFDFPEEKEKEQVDRHEDTHDACFQEQHQRHVFLDAHLLPPSDDSQHSQQGIEDDHGQAQSINTEVVIYSELYWTGFQIDPWQVNGIGEIFEITKMITVGGDAEEYYH